MPARHRLIKSPLLVAGSVAFCALTPLLAGCPIYDEDSCYEDETCRGRDYDYGDAAAPPLGDGYSSYDGAPSYDAPSKTDGAKDGDAISPTGCAISCPAGQVCSSKTDAGFACVVLPTTDPNACKADTDCTAKTGAGSLCLGGVCKPRKDICSDATQCAAGRACVDGRCIPSCANGAPCPTGYTCDTTGGRNVCIGKSTGNTCSSSASCAAGNVCVGSRCVPQCGLDGACAAGSVCVAGGCVVDDRPNFVCDKTGTAEGKRDTCAVGSICLHHNCYIACGGGDAGANPSACTTPELPICKSVTTTSGKYDVCGSSETPGNGCDPTDPTRPACATGAVCIDGVCR